MQDVFISHSSKDAEQATSLCNLLENRGYSCFISSRDLVPGQEYAMQLVTNIEESKCVVLLLTSHSNASPHVLREVEYAVSHKIPILVYVLEEVILSKSMAYFLTTHQWINMGPDQTYKLLEGMENITGKQCDKYSVPPNLTPSTSTESTSETAPSKSESFKVPMILIAVVAVLLLFTGVTFYFLKKMESDNKRLQIAYEEAIHNATQEIAKVSEEESELIEETEEDSETISFAEAEEAVDLPQYELGEIVYFGTYLDTTIPWYVIDVSEDGKNVTLLSKDILTLRIFDAAEGGSYNYYNGVDYWTYENHIITDPEISVQARGSSDWSTSNIRTWLNSDKKNVKYSDQAPTRAAAGTNFYDTKPGFLSEFTKDEVGAITLVDHDGALDKVYFLSSKELSLLENADLHVYAYPGETCALDCSTMEDYNAMKSIYGVTSYYWWLRDCPYDEPSKVYIVYTEYETGLTEYPYTDTSVGMGDYGVRPALTVDVSLMELSREEN